VKSVDEANDENIDTENYIDHDDDKDIEVINAITASDKLGMACYRYVTKNSFSLPNCEYSYDRDVVAAARDKQMSDLTEAKRLIQAGHQSTSKAFVRYNPLSTYSPQMRPTHFKTTPRLFLLSQDARMSVSKDCPYDQALSPRCSEARVTECCV